MCGSCGGYCTRPIAVHLVMDCNLVHTRVEVGDDFREDLVVMGHLCVVLGHAGLMVDDHCM